MHLLGRLTMNMLTSATMRKYVLTLLSPKEVRARWETLHPLLQKAERYSQGEILAEDVPALVDEQRAFVLALYEDELMILAGAFEAIVYPRKTVMHTLLLGGRSLGVVFEQFMTGVSELAAKMGATALRGCVRPEMERLLLTMQPESRILYSVWERDL